MGKCKESMATFIEKCLTGQTQPDQIDDYVQQWHEADTTLPLHTYLGLSQQQYAAWVETPGTLLKILETVPEKTN